jgi:uncharacterized Fe-S cluster-containing protein
MSSLTLEDLPGLNCGLCGFKKCETFAVELQQKPELIKRCLHLSKQKASADPAAKKQRIVSVTLPSASCDAGCGACATQPEKQAASDESLWTDSLGRPFDFFLEHFPEDPGPREIIIPHNPMITRELEVKEGDILIGRPLGMSCGCPITHCGVVTNVDPRTGVIVWCVTGPLKPRELGYKDLGYYIAEGYEGMIRQPRCEIKIGMRYYFQPRMCMLQWRHSGLVNYLNKSKDGLQVRVEGLWIG